jgi:hypothetical protein
MYTPIIPGIAYGSELNVILTFDVSTLMDLVSSNIIAVNRSISYYTRSKGKMYKDGLMNEIGVHMEMIQNAVFFSIQEKEIKLDAEMKAAIKKLFTKVEKLIRKLGACDSDFITMSTTQRARPSKEVMEFIQKKW